MAGKTNYSIEQAAEIMGCVLEQMREGGSFRSFIYGSLGFEQDAYVDLYTAGVMDFTNATPVNLEPEIGPSITWIGVHQVTAADGTHVEYNYFNQFTEKEATEKAPFVGDQPKVGDWVASIYLCRPGIQSKYAICAGEHLRIDQLVEKVEALPHQI